MSYDVSFQAKLEDVDQWVVVGPQWINHTSDTAAMIKEVCGSYPSEWNNKKCAELLPVLTVACEALRAHPENYRQFEAGYGTVETTLKFLDDIRITCANFPTALIDVFC